MCQRRLALSLPFIDLQSQFIALESRIRSKIDQVLEHGQYIMGPEVRELEQELANDTQMLGIA